MHLTYKNVNEAFAGLVYGIADGSVPTRKAETRNGPVLQVNDPIIVTYEKPLERVLLNQARDANCFFHLFESLYMLSGGNKISPLAYYAEQIKQYSDDGVTQNGAYGNRWRQSTVAVMENDVSSFKVKVDKIYTTDIKDVRTVNRRSTIIQGSVLLDQLAIIIDHLKKNTSSRRAVLQMWNVEDDLMKIDSSVDVCCNLEVMFSITNRQYTIPGVLSFVPMYRNELDMTVTNRSNDMIWGMLGANVVHFSFLQEYMAAQIGVAVGKYHQFSNNLHVYTETNSGFKPELWGVEKYEDYKSSWEHIPLVKDCKVFDEELPKFVELFSGNSTLGTATNTVFTEPFFVTVAQPMLLAFMAHKARSYEEALWYCAEIDADDWRYVATNWINKRKENWEAKQSKEVIK